MGTTEPSAVTGFDQLREQQQQIVPAIDRPVTQLGIQPWRRRRRDHGTDHLLVKMILGYRFKLKRLWVVEGRLVSAKGVLSCWAGLAS